MKGIRIAFPIALVLTLFGGLSAYAQGSQSPQAPPQPVSQAGSFSVTISSNASGADIIIDGKLVAQTPATVEVTAGKHSLVVRSQGYHDYHATITATGPTQVEAYLQPVPAGAHMP